MPQPSLYTFRRTPRRGFTLTELLISVVLALLIIYGVNKVFSSSANAIGAGLKLNEINRGLKAAQTTLHNDFVGAQPTGTYGMMPGTTAPWLVIASSTTPAFRDRQDETEKGNDPTLKTPYRTDILNFFAQGTFRRQTGQGAQMLASGVMNEAWMSYGHLALPNDNANPDARQFDDPRDGGGAGDYRFPGADKTLVPNPNNYYASQWMLGREAILLHPAGTTYAGNPMNQWVRLAYLDTIPLSPLSRGSLAYAGDVGTLDEKEFPVGAPRQIQQSYYDLAARDTGLLRSDIATVSSAYPNWYEFVTYRFNAKPWFTRPLTPEAAALMSPIFVQHCTDFAVEYAGDYLKQAADGTVTGPGVDGTIDFENDPTTSVRSIRWYGLERPGTPVRPPSQSLAIPLAVPNLAFPFERAYTPSTQYTVAWDASQLSGPAKPAMLRLVMTVADPNRRIDAPVTQEFVFTVP